MSRNIRKRKSIYNKNIDPELLVDTHTKLFKNSEDPNKMTPIDWCVDCKKSYKRYTEDITICRCKECQRKHVITEKKFDRPYAREKAAKLRERDFIICERNNKLRNFGYVSNSIDKND